MQGGACVRVRKTKQRVPTKKTLKLEKKYRLGRRTPLRVCVVSHKGPRAYGTEEVCS